MIQKCFAVTLTNLRSTKCYSEMSKFIIWRNICGKLTSYDRYHDNRNPSLEKLPEYNIVRTNSFISMCYERKYFTHIELLL